MCKFGGLEQRITFLIWKQKDAQSATSENVLLLSYPRYHDVINTKIAVFH